MRFRGGIIITDPCCIMLSNEDWLDSQFGECLEEQIMVGEYRRRVVTFLKRALGVS